MLNKLRLDQAGTYERAVGAYEIAKMLVSFVQGQSHPLEIGTEQGGIQKWDDFVIYEASQVFTHIQIKRQTTDQFGSPLDECRRNPKQGTEDLRDLSELDKTIQSLGKWIKTKGITDQSKREFRLELYDGGVSIKKGFKVSDLINILEVHCKPNITTPDGLKALHDDDNSMQKCTQWLESWCEIEGFDQILNLFNVLTVRHVNTEAVLKEQTLNCLKAVFKSTSLEEVYGKLIFYILDNTAFTGAIQPRHLLCKLTGHLLPGIERWTRFQQDGSNWNISGINDLEINGEIERSHVVVPALWSLENETARSLVIDGSCIPGCCTSESLIRLAIHAQGLFHVHCSDKSSWDGSIRSKVGGTIGLSENDIDAAQLHLVDGADSFTPSESRFLTTAIEHETQAKTLHDEMYKTTFKIVDIEITSKIRAMKPGDLRTEMEGLWQTWKGTLEVSVEDQKMLFTKILHPKAEGESVSGEIRVGPKSVNLLKDAIFLLLVVSVCLSDEDYKESWESIDSRLDMTSIGLAYWSGPSESTGDVIRIDADNGLSKLLEKESSQIIIISQSEFTEGEVFKDDILGNIDKVALLMHPHYPKLLISFCSETSVFT